MKIAVAGTGCVGLAIATLLVRYHEVVASGVISEKMNLLNYNKAPIWNEQIDWFLRDKKLNLFEISTFEAVIELFLKAKIDSVMVIKRIVLVGDAASAFNKQDKQGYI